MDLLILVIAILFLLMVVSWVYEHYNQDEGDSEVDFIDNLVKDTRKCNFTSNTDKRGVSLVYEEGNLTLSKGCTRVTYTLSPEECKTLSNTLILSLEG